MWSETSPKHCQSPERVIWCFFCGCKNFQLLLSVWQMGGHKFQTCPNSIIPNITKMQMCFYRISTPLTILVLFWAIRSSLVRKFKWDHNKWVSLNTAAYAYLKNAYFYERKKTKWYIFKILCPSDKYRITVLEEFTKKVLIQST